MTCLVKSLYKDKIQKLAKVVGSEEAAYYLLASNNGYSLDKDPTGQRSQLYFDLQEAYKIGPNLYDESKVILAKAVCYLPEFAAKHGAWLELFDKNGNHFPEPDASLVSKEAEEIMLHSSIAGYLSDPNYKYDLLQELINRNSTVLLELDDVVKQYFEKDRIQYIELYMSGLLNLSEKEELEKRNLARQLYNINKLHEVISGIKESLANFWNMELLQNGSVDESKYTDNINKFRARFINTLQERASDPLYNDAIISIIKQSINNVSIGSTVKPIVEQYLNIYHDAPIIEEALQKLFKTNTKDPEDVKKGLANLKIILCDRSLIYSADTKKSIFSKVIKSFWTAITEITYFVWHSVKYVPKKLLGRDTSYVPLFILNKLLHDVEDLILVYTSLNEDLSASKSYLSSLDTWVGKDVKDVESALRYIKEGLISKKKSILSVANKSSKNENLANLVRINQQLDAIKLALTAFADAKGTKEAEFFDAFLSSAMEEIDNAFLYLGKCRDSNVEPDIKKLMDIKVNVIGFYYNMFQNCIDPILENITHPLFKNGKQFEALPGNITRVVNDLKNKLNVTKDLFDKVLLTYLENYLDEYVDMQMTFIPPKLRVVAKTNAKYWLKNMINDGDLSPFDLFITPSRANNSMIVRIIKFMIENINTDIEREARAVANDLEFTRTENRTFWDRISLLNQLNRYAERDANGDFTGNFLAEINRGEYDRQYREKCIELCHKYGGQINDDTGEVEFPDDDDNEKWRQYNDDLDRWIGGIDKHGNTVGEVKAHRKYKALYYIDRRKFLSRRAIELDSNISKLIADLYKLCMRKVSYKRNGKTVTENIPVTADLTPANRTKLNQLIDLKHQLANPFIIITDAAGNITSIQEKTGEDLEIAKQFLAWNEHKKRMTYKYGYKPDFEKYNAVLKILEDELKTKQLQLNTLTPGTVEYTKLDQDIKLSEVLLEKFKYDSTISRINPILYENLEKVTVTSVVDPELLLLLAKRRQITDIAKRSKGFSALDLSRLNNETFTLLKEIDQQIADFKRQNKGIKILEEKEQGAFKYKELFNDNSVMYLDPVTKQPTAQSYYYHLQQKSGSLNLSAFIDKYHYVNEFGKKVPLSIFSYASPKPEAANKIFGTSNTSVLIETTPSGLYTIFDDENPYKDSDFDETSDEYVQVDKNTFKNKNFTKEIAEDPIYKKMLEVMEKAWLNYAGINRGYKYKLPQLEADASQLWSRRDWSNPFKATWEQLLYKWHMLKDITTLDTDVNEDLVKMSDGTIVESIPIRLVGRLKNPVMISTDLIHSVSLFYLYSLQYAERQRIAPLMQAIKFEVEGGYSRPGSSDQSLTIEHELSRSLYGRQVTGFGKGGRLTEKDKKLAKVSKILRSATHRKLMSHNWVSVIKNGWDSLCNFFSQIFTGKYFGVRNLFNAVVHLGKNIFQQVMSINRSRSISDTDALMSMNGIADAFSERYAKLNQWWIRRFRHKFSTMEFEAIDYTYKALITESVYDAYRLLKNPITGKYEFVIADLAEMMYLGVGASREDGRNAWNHSNIKLRNMYKKQKDGTMVLKDKVLTPDGVMSVLDLVRPLMKNGKRSTILESRVAQTIKTVSGMVNGMLNNEDKNKLASNYAGAVTVAFRGWMIAQGTEFYKNGTDFYEYEEITGDTEEAKRAFKKILTDIDFDGQFSFWSGTVDKGLHLSILKTLRKNARLLPTLMIMSKSFYKKHGMSESEYYSLRNYVASLVFFSLTIAITCALYNLCYVDSDDDDWVSSLLYAGSIASISERASQLGLMGFAASASDFTKSVTVLTAYLEDIKYLSMLMDDIFRLTYAKMSKTYVSDSMPDTEIIARNTFKNSTVLDRDITKTISLFNVDDLSIELGLDLLNTIGILGDNFKDVKFRDYNLNYKKNTTKSANDYRATFYSNIWPTGWVKSILSKYTKYPIYGTQSAGRKSNSGKSNARVSD